MLIVEQLSNGRRIVKLHKDWHPGRLGLSHNPKPRNYVEHGDMEAVQQALLRNRRIPNPTI
jgi:hypothetical protein